MLPIVCPQCQQPLHVDESVLGKVVACPNCGQQMSLPTPSVAGPALVPAPAADNPFAGLGNSPVPATEEQAAAHENVFADFESKVQEAEEAECTKRLWEELPRPMPPEVAQLGTPRHIYASEGHVGFMWRILGGAIALWVFLAVGVTISALTGSPMGNGLILLIGLSISLGIFYFVILGRGAFRIILFDEAMVYQRRRRYQVIPWTIVQHVQHFFTRVVSRSPLTMEHKHSVRIRLDRRPPLYLDETLIGFESLAVQVIHEAGSKQLPGAMETLRNGGKLILGDIAIDNGGIRAGTFGFRWDELAACIVIQEALCFRRKFQPEYCLRLPIALVPRYFLLTALAEAYIGDRE